MTIYPNLNVSIINELPPGRISITTSIISNTRRLEIIKRIKQIFIKKRRQIYWVCYTIEKSNFSKIQSAQEVYEELKILLPELHIELIHSRVKEEKKNKK